ncbi:RagB/SusD family nutrient uptake outer membrane protein [Dysgonomonas sp. OttesenSCG-928-M03]|nr:RagB/SusD family nutrient uptake outer membrane protein [Dysgonomonas sp. OttesenSCG-928-M03]
MKKIMIYMVMAGSLLLGNSCADLDQEPQSFVTTQQFFETATTNDISLFIDGLYSSLWQGNYGFSCRLMRINTGADDMTTSPTKLNNVLNYIRDLSPNLTSNDADFTTPWSFFYKVIYDANMCIEYTKIDTGDAETRKALVGEAQFMRALSYFYLVRLFGDVPFYLKNEEASDAMPRTSVAEVYENGIIPGLQQAIELLPATSRAGNSSRPSKWAAEACLAEVYMTMAGWPLKKGQEYYAKSAEISLNIINNSGLSLTASYPDLWKETLKTQANEHMFAIHNSVADKMASQYGKSFYPADFYPKAGWSDYYANEAFMLKYPEGERKDWNYMTEWAINETTTVNYKDSKDGVPAISKYYDYDNGKPGASAQSNGLTPIYRYADVLLMYAEASNLATGTVNATALKCLQEVQNRAKSSIITTTTNSEEFDKAVFAERGWEFLAEFKRWFDLVRREKLAESKPTEWASSLYKANNHYYLPVPSKQIELTGWSNNPGY